MNLLTIRRALVTIIVLVLLPLSLTAHHSRAELDVRIRNDDGSTEIWRVETYGSPNLFSRMGVKQEYFIVGEQISIAKCDYRAAMVAGPCRWFRPVRRQSQQTG